MEMLPKDEVGAREPRWTRVGLSFALSNGYEGIELRPGLSVSGTIMLKPPPADFSEQRDS